MASVAESSNRRLNESGDYVGRVAGPFDLKYTMGKDEGQCVRSDNAWNPLNRPEEELTAEC